MKKNFQTIESRKFTPHCIFIALLILLPMKTHAQPYVIKGTLFTPTVPVRYASIVFTNSNDTTQKFSALTDTLGNYQIGVITTLVSPHNNQPTKFELTQNYPNPFSVSTAISYNLKTQADAVITIFDILGREVRKFTIDMQIAGIHGIMWDGMNDFGKKVATGIYFYRLQAGGEAQVKKMIFGLGGGNAIIPVPKIFSLQIAETRKNISISGSVVTFTVNIGYTDSTYPLIAPRLFNRVRVQSDTILNFSSSLLSTAVVDLGNTQQIIRGFGGANIVGWDPGLGYGDMTAGEIQTVFGNGPGQLGFSIMRLRIPPDSTKFNINVPSAKLAESLGAKVIATPWTPPAWMKTNNNIVGGSLDTNKYAAFAAYLKSFADTMASNGVPLYAVSVQNEPDFIPTDYEGCGWNAIQFLNFMKNYAPAVGTPVFMPESAGFVHSLSDMTLNDSVAASHVAFIGGHLYGTTPSSYPLALSKSKEVWMTEYLINSSMNGPDMDTSMAANLRTAKSINDCMNANMNAYVWWYIVRFYGPINDTTQGGIRGNVTKKGYVMSQYARFVRPGYYRVAATATSQPNVFITAYKDNSMTVIVVINMNSYSAIQPFSLSNGSAEWFTPFVTSNTKNCEEQNSVIIKNGSFTYKLDPLSVTTFVSN